MKISPPTEALPSDGASRLPRSARAALALASVPLILWTIVLLAPTSPEPPTEPRLGAAEAVTGSDPVAGVPPATLFSKVTEVEFGTVELGQSASRRLVLTNGAVDDTTITVSSTWLAEPDAREYSSDFRQPLSLAPGESITIELTFSPEELGERVGALYVSHDGASGLDIFTLVGRGGASSRALAKPQFRAKALEAATLSFGKSVLGNLGTSVKPTSLQFGPDGRLYVADMLGLIKVLDVERDGANDYRVTAVETITAIRDIPNHDDDGMPNPAIDKRLVTGLLVAGTASSPIIYVGSSDPRIGGGANHTETDLDTNSGVISRLTPKVGGGWQKLDLVRGLPRSEENHHPNGLALDAARNLLYVATGGNTNMGAPSNNFALLPEYALSAAILEIDLGMIGESTYDLPTLDDETRPGVADANDPFGGNDGLNQARLPGDGPVRVYAPGFRNAYDIVLTDDGRMYTIDNGPNSGWGGIPAMEGPGGECTNAQQEPGETYPDSLHHVSARGYYGGHPNPTRGSLANTFNDSNPQSAVDFANAVECDYRAAGGASALTTFPWSTNGLVEYRASNFGGALAGDLLTAAWNGSIQRLELEEEGTALAIKSALFSNVGSTPLDVTAQPDDGVFPGTIWVADFGTRAIYVFEPVDYGNVGGGTGGDTGGLCPWLPGGTAPDHDGDGFADDDEQLNGTDPCSAADQPADLDGDGVSDLVDTDDDGDLLEDHFDPFARDPLNGRGTALPLSYTWENDSSPPGFLFNLGFSGLMANGETDYLALFGLERLTTGGAAGVLTIDDVPPGDPIGSRNDQAYAFQFGVDATPSTPTFTVRTRILAPFSGVETGGHQSIGLYIGTGDQDNYIKLVANVLEPDGGVQFLAERDGSASQVALVPAPVFGADEIDLFLTVDPAAGTVEGHYRSVADGVTGALTKVGGATTLPMEWLSGESGLAVGIISTSYGGEPFSATWDFVEIGMGDAAAQLDGGKGGGTGGSTGGGGDALTIAVEAERFVSTAPTATHSWVEGTRGGSSGGSMVTTPDVGSLKSDSTDSPRLSYTVNFPEAGVWTVWVRGWGDADGGEGKSDSVHVGLDGILSSAAAIQGFPSGGWAWSNERRQGGTATVEVATAGARTLDVWMREDGLEIDGVVLSRESGFVPVGAAALGSGDSSGDGTGGDGGGSDGGSDGGTTILIEAEDFTSATSTATHRWEAGASAGAFGSSMIALPDVGALQSGSSGSPRLGFEVELPSAGLYTVEVRGRGDADASGEGKSDSVHVGLDGALSSAAAIQGFPDGVWRWSSERRLGGTATLEVATAGTHTLDVWMREDGFEIDALRLELLSDGTGGDGGGDGSNEGDTAMRIDSSTEWSVVESTDETSATPRHEAGGVALGGRFYLLGGRGSRPVDIFDPVAGRWTTGVAPPFQMHHFQPVVLGDRIHVVGAMSCCYPVEESVPNLWSYIPADDRWEKGMSVPVERRRGGAAAVVRDGKIYLVGGNTRGHDGGAVAWFDEIDPAKDTWRVLPDAPEARDHVQAALIGDRLVVAGGRRSTRPNVQANTVAGTDVFDFTSASWARGANIPTQRAGASSVAVGGELVVIGGETAGQSAAHDEVEAYDAATNRWRSLRPLRQGRHGAGAALLADGLHVVSGNVTRGGGAETDSHERIEVQRAFP